MAAKKYETIKVEKGEGITWVMFNRPEKRNAMSPQLHLEMDDVLDDLAIDDETDVTDKRFVEDRVDGLAVVLAALRQALHPRSFGRCDAFHF